MAAIARAAIAAAALSGLVRMDKLSMGPLSALPGADSPPDVNRRLRRFVFKANIAQRFGARI
jgi:hypothetical protein